MRQSALEKHIETRCEQLTVSHQAMLGDAAIAIIPRIQKLVPEPLRPEIATIVKEELFQLYRLWGGEFKATKWREWVDLGVNSLRRQTEKQQSTE